MKKSLLALAVLGAFAATAQAQVTVYGSFDAGVRHQTNVTTKDAAGTVTDKASSNNNTTMSSSGTYNSNRFGFKGVEDLGNGLNAHFVLEGDFNSGTGAQASAGGLFRRAANVGLGGSWGSLDLGRQYTVIFNTTGAYDPFNYKYTGIIPVAGLDGARHDNAIKYTGTFGAITARAEYALGEQAGSTSAGAAEEVGVSYAGGPFSAGAAYGTSKDKTAAENETKNWTVGGAYKTGPFRVAIGYDKKDADLLDAKTKNWWLGGSYAMSPAAALSAAYYETKTSATGSVDGKKKLFIVGATYALSKRTNFYADIDRANLDGSLQGTEDSQTGFSVGINHLF